MMKIRYQYVADKKSRYGFACALLGFGKQQFSDGKSGRFGEFGSPTFKVVDTDRQGVDNKVEGMGMVKWTS